MTKREKGLLLGGLLLVLGTLMFVDRLEQEDEQFQTPDTLGAKSQSQATRGQGSQSSGMSRTLVNIELNTPRNIFASLRDPNQPKPKVAKLSPKPKTIAPSAPTPPTSKPVPPRNTPPPPPSPNTLAIQQAQQQLKQFQFLGYLTKQGEQQVFLSNGQAIYIMKQGETLEGDIQVKSIEATTVVLSKHLKSIGETVEATLPLTKEGSKT